MKQPSGLKPQHSNPVPAAVAFSAAGSTASVSPDAAGPPLDAPICYGITASYLLAPTLDRDNNKGFKGCASPASKSMQ